MMRTALLVNLNLARERSNVTTRLHEPQQGRSNDYQKPSWCLAGLTLTATSSIATTWDLSSEYPAGSLQGQTADFFAKTVADKTGGEVEVIVHHGAALGYKSVDHFDAVGDGACRRPPQPSYSGQG